MKQTQQLSSINSAGLEGMPLSMLAAPLMALLLLLLLMVMVMVRT
jgi:hypothetical protein